MFESYHSLVDMVDYFLGVTLLADQDEIGRLDATDALLASAVLQSDRVVFAALQELVEGRRDYLIAWSPVRPLEEGWTIRGQVGPSDVTAGSQVIGADPVPVWGDPLSGVQHRVGTLGPPHSVVLEVASDTLLADSLSTTVLSARIVDAFGQTSTYDSQSIVTFTALNGSALIDGPVTVQVDSGRAATTLLAGTVPGTVEISAATPDLPAATVAVVLQADVATSIELSATPSILHLDEDDQIEVRAILRDVRNNIVSQDSEEMLFELVGPGNFSDLSTRLGVALQAGVAAATVQATRAGSLQVRAAFGELAASLIVPVISAEVSRVKLEADELTLPADGSRPILLTASLLDGQSEVRTGDDTTQVHFSIVNGHGLLGGSTQRAVDQGRVQIQLQGLGIAGPIVVRVEAAGLEAGELALTAVAARPVRLDLVSLPRQIRADGLSTSVIAAVVRDSLGNIVVDADVEVHFSIQAGEAEIIGPLQPQATGGTARTTLRSSVRAGNVVVRATTAGLSAGETVVRLTAGAPAKLALEATPLVLAANAAATARISAAVQDLYGNPVVDDSTTLVSFSISGGPGRISGPNLVRVQNGKAETILATAQGAGQILVFAGAVDLAPATVAVDVRQAQAPKFKTLPERVELVEDGDPVRLSIANLVEDEDTAIEDLHFTFAPDTLHISVTVEGDELVFLAGEPDYFGTQTVQLTVRDPTHIENSAFLVVDVLPRNDSPIITSVPDTLTLLDTLYVYELEALDVDGDRLQYSLVQGPPGMGFDRVLHRAVWPPSSTGVFSVGFAVSDGEIIVEQNFLLHVLSTENRLRFDSNPPTRVRRGDLFTYRSSVVDPMGAAVSYRLAEGPQRMRVNATTGLLTWISDPTDPPSVDVALVASNGVHETQQRFRIRLDDDNTAPEITSQAQTVTWVDSLYIYPMEALDADGDTLIFQIVQGPADMRVNPFAGIFAWQPKAADAGAVELVLAANDGELITTQSYILEILFEPGLQPPRLSPPNGLALDAAADYMATLVLNPLVHDPDHADSALVWTLTHISGDAVTIDYDRFAQTARFTARPDFAAAQVRLQVSDPDSLSAEIVLHLAVLQSGDFNNDTTIDQSDLVPFVEAFGARPEQHDRWNENVDLNGDGRIDFADFFLFLFAK